MSLIGQEHKDDGSQVSGAKRSDLVSAPRSKVLVSSFCSDDKPLIHVNSDWKAKSEYEV